MNVNNFICEPDLDLSAIDRNEDNLIITDCENLIKIKRYIGFSIEKIMADSDAFPVVFKSGSGYDFFSFVILDGNQMDMDFEKITLILMDKLLIIVINSQIQHRMARKEFVEEVISGSTTTMYIAFMKLFFSEMYARLCEYEDHLYRMKSELISGRKKDYFMDIVHEREMSLMLKKHARQLSLSIDALMRNRNTLIPEKEIGLLHNVRDRIALLSELACHLTEISAHLIDIYRSAVSIRRFDALRKVSMLSFFATIMIAISGIFGMIFIIQLDIPPCYYIMLGVLLGISCIIFLVLTKLSMNFK